MITTICLNPSFDMTVEVDAFVPYEVNRIRSVRRDVGGKGLNVAIVAHRLGLDVQCLGCMGMEDAESFTQMVAREGMPHHFLPVPGRVRTNTKIVSRDGKGVTELNEPGDPIGEGALRAFIDMARQHVTPEDMIVLTGSLPPGCPPETYRDMIAALGGAHCILDAQGEALIRGAEAHPLLIKPNLQELEHTLGIELRTLRSIRDAAMIFLHKGVEHVMVSMGSMGAMYVSAKNTLYAPALRVEASSTVGAGDAMIGGILKGMAVERDMAKAFRYGIAAGAASVMTEGTQLIRPEDFERLLSQVRVQEV